MAKYQGKRGDIGGRQEVGIWILGQKPHLKAKIVRFDVRSAKDDSEMNQLPIVILIVEPN